MEQLNPTRNVDAAPKLAAFGDVWRLGEHVLFVGDGTNAETLARVFGNEAETLALIDPPYGIGITTQKGRIGQIRGTKRTKSFIERKYGRKLEVIRHNTIKGDESRECGMRLIEAARSRAKNQIIFGGNYFADVLPPTNNWFIWDKCVPEKTSFSKYEMAWGSFKTCGRIMKFRWSGICREGSRKIELARRIHPTQKPATLFAKIIGEHTAPKQTVLDNCAGVGATLIACEVSGRICHAVEYSTDFADWIIERWKRIAKQEPELIENINGSRK